MASGRPLTNAAMKKKRSMSMKKRKTSRRIDRIIKLSPKTRWKAIINKVINNLSWLSEKEEDKEDKKEGTEVITQYDKFLLFKDPSERREEDLMALAKRVSVYKSLRKYSTALRVSLLRKAKFVAFNRSVELVRQGMNLENMYVLTKGTGIATHISYADGRETKEITNMREGHVVGEHPLLYNKPSLNSITGDGPTEWIVFPKHHFVSYAKDELIKQYYSIECALKKFFFFDKMTNTEFRDYCVSSEITTVEPNTVLPLIEETVSITYFILEGRCTVLQKLVLIKDPILLYPGYRLHPDQNTDDPEAESFIVRTCFLTRRGVFGLGEEATKWVIVTETECQFMVIPRFLLQKYGRNKIWERVKGQLNDAYPSIESIYKQFIENRIWDKYRKQFYKSLQTRKSGNTIHNVPVTSRCKELQSDDEDDIIKKVKKRGTKDVFEGLDLKNEIKKFEAQPQLKELLEYLPKDGTF